MKLVKTLLVAVIISGFSMTSSFASDDGLVAKGKKIFATKSLGNCNACHNVKGDAQINKDGPGSFGPELQGLTYWDDKTLYDTIYDIYAARDLKISPMPAFGKNGWLDDAEIKAVVAYLKTIQ